MMPHSAAHGSKTTHFATQVTFTAAADEGIGCDPNVTLHFPPHSIVLNPSLPLKLTTAETRVEPAVVFSCTPGKL
jgi:hypothetical protein